MPIFSLGALNTAALVTPGVYVHKIPPRTRFIDGVPTRHSRPGRRGFMGSSQ